MKDAWTSLFVIAILCLTVVFCLLAAQVVLKEFVVKPVVEGQEEATRIIVAEVGVKLNVLSAQIEGLRMENEKLRKDICVVYMDACEEEK